MLYLLNRCKTKGHTGQQEESHHLVEHTLPHGYLQTGWIPQNKLEHYQPTRTRPFFEVKLKSILTFICNDANKQYHEVSHVAVYKLYRHFFLNKIFPNRVLLDQTVSWISFLKAHHGPMVMNPACIQSDHKAPKQFVPNNNSRPHRIRVSESFVDGLPSGKLKSRPPKGVGKRNEKLW